jgi:hypothetical protein
MPQIPGEGYRNPGKEPRSWKGGDGNAEKLLIHPEQTTWLPQIGTT